MSRPSETLYTVCQTLIAIAMIIAVTAALGVRWNPSSPLLIGTIASAAIPILAFKFYCLDP